MANDVVVLSRAFDFAARKHARQRRLGKNEEPYLNHLAEVAKLLAEATDGGDTELVVAGLLHDTIEDTDATHGEISGHFGPTVADLVLEVSDDCSLPLADRKLLQIETAARKSPRAKMLKLADKTSNVRSIVRDPPKIWPHDERREYVMWSAQVVDGCRGVNAFLEVAFDHAHTEAMAVLQGRGRGPTAA